MPIYDYVCSSCSTRTEFIHAIDAAPPRFCPVCGAEDTLRKVFVAPTVHFKGSGWAKKDRSGSGGTKSKGSPGKATDGTGESTADGGTAKAEPAADAGTGSSSSPASEG